MIRSHTTLTLLILLPEVETAFGRYLRSIPHRYLGLQYGLLYFTEHSLAGVKLTHVACLRLKPQLYLLLMRNLQRLNY